MKRFNLSLLVLLGTAAGCGDSNEGTGGSGGDPLAQESSYRLGCTIDTLVLELPIELSYRLDRPYIAGASSELTFSAAVTFSEEAAAAFVDAGVGKVDIISLEIASWVEGATPSMVETSLAAAPINDFDLEADTDDNGLPGPHRLELETTRTTSSPAEGADHVELGLSTDQISMVLGDFEVPADCQSPSLVGFTTRFPVEPSE